VYWPAISSIGPVSRRLDRGVVDWLVCRRLALLSGIGLVSRGLARRLVDWPAVSSTGLVKGGEE